MLGGVAYYLVRDGGDEWWGGVEEGWEGGVKSDGEIRGKGSSRELPGWELEKKQHGINDYEA